MKILLATDGSDCSDEAAAFLTRFPFGPQDNIIVFHVVSAVPYEDDYRQQVLQVIKKISPRILKSAEDALSSTRALVASEEAQGIPEEEIVKAADRHVADMIVMGARGARGIASLFLGSVTRAVAAMTARPVLVTRPSVRTSRKSMKILFAVDGSDASDAAAAVLNRLPFPSGAEVTIMNIGWSAAADIPDRYAMEINDAMKAELAAVRMAESGEAEKIVDAARDLLAARFGTIRCVVRGGDPAEEVLKTAGELDADIIVTGSRGLKGMRGMLGSVSRRILGRAPCPVLVVKGKSG